MMMMILTAVVVLGVLVFVHELGHFLVAKRARVGVLKFSLGSGQARGREERGDGVPDLSPPAGRLRQDDRGGSDRRVAGGRRSERSFSRKSVGVRSLIILAGPLSNILLRS